MRFSGHVPNSLVYFAAGGVAMLSFLSAACGDDEIPDTATGGMGGGGSGSGNEGGIMAGPVGSGGSAGGDGGQGNQGGTGEAVYDFDVVYGDADINNRINPKDVAIDGDGNIIVVGSYAGTIDVGGGAGNELPALGGDNVFVAKYSSIGEHIWSIGVGDNADQSALSVATDATGNIWVSGTVKGTFSFPGGSNLSNGNNQFPNAWVVKLNPAGGHQFSSSYGVNADYSDSGRAVASGPNDSLLFAGTFQNNITFNTLHMSTAGSYSMFLVRYDNTNAITLERTFGGGERQDANAVAVAGDGSIAIGGSTQGNIDFGGGELMHAGSGEKAVVAKLDAMGNEVFAALFTSGGEAEITDVTFDAGGDLFITGNFAESIDLGDGDINANGGAKEVFIARFDATGGLVYRNRFGGIGSDIPAAVAIDANGYASIAGSFTDDVAVNNDQTLSFGAMTRDAFVIRVGPPGNGYWGEQTSAMTDAFAAGLAIDPTDDKIVVVGTFTDQIDPGGGATGAGVQVGMFIAKYGPGD